MDSDPIDDAVANLVAQNVVVTAAAGNDGVRLLAPPATAPEALTIGGLDDQNDFDYDTLLLWHSNYGEGTDYVSKPELVAPSIWLAAPLLPDTEVAREAAWLFANRHQHGNSEAIETRLGELKLITPHYQHVDGTSFAAPIVASAVACMLEANLDLTPPSVREILVETAHLIPNTPRERQGGGALEAGIAAAYAIRHRHQSLAAYAHLPHIGEAAITFALHDHDAQQAQVLGSWDGWAGPGLVMIHVEDGIWRVERPLLPPGDYAYKFLLDGWHWLDDPTNPRKVWDGHGGFNSWFEINEPRIKNTAQTD